MPCWGVSSILQFLPCSPPPFRWGWKEYLKKLWFSHHRKWNVELPTERWQRNPWSLFLSTHTPTRAQTACTNSVWGFSPGIGKALQELLPHHGSSSDHRHLTIKILLPPQSSGFQTTVWVTEHPSLIVFLLCLFVRHRVYSACMCYSQYVRRHSVSLHFSIGSSPRSFSLSVSHLACFSSIGKQTHFLLTLGSVAVICCACQVEYWVALWPLSTKGRPRKPQGQRYLCVGRIISPTRHSACSHCLVCNWHAACRCQDGSLVTSTRRTCFTQLTLLKVDITHMAFLHRQQSAPLVYLTHWLSGQDPAAFSRLNVGWGEGIAGGRPCEWQVRWPCWNWGQGCKEFNIWFLVSGAPSFPVITVQGVHG